MNRSRRAFLTLAGTRAAPVAAPPALDTARAGISDDPHYHLLSRITWGVQAAELDYARTVGYAAYLEEQLHPESLDDGAAEAVADAALADFPILAMDRHTIHRLQDAEWRSYKSLARSMVVRAVHSRRQLLERMVEFWGDHFNVPAHDTEYAPEVVLLQREVLRKHALGRFRDLVTGVARSPAMLYYLDNYANVKEHPNENYARELLELHTLGVDGGYTEADVKDVARAFTGWTVHDHAADGFYFDPSTHDDGPKTVLGRQLPGGRGIDDGYHVLAIVSDHPSTAAFLSHKLCMKFVSDSPPASLVASTAAVWQETRGDIRAVLRHLFMSAEFMAAAGQKFRRPLDFYIAALRATGTRIDYPWLEEELLADLGQRPFGWQPPNGYPEPAGAWMSTGGLLARWNVASRLTHGAHSEQWDDGYGVTSFLNDRVGAPATVGELVDEVATAVFGTPLPGALRQVYVDYLGQDEYAPATTHLRAGKLASLFSLMLASPEFQWR